MKRIELIVAYDGTDYCGWQVQDNGITVEEVLNTELSRLLNEEIQVIGASRTDSGVHAMGNVCVFDTETRIPPEKIAFALNVRLPEDIRIQGSFEVPGNFHPRHCNSVKTYEYRIWNGTFMNPVVRRYTKFCYYPLNLENMQKAADILVGEHDFKSFCSTRTNVENTVRTIYSLDIIEKKDPVMNGSTVVIRVTGNGFLYNMVRIIAGTLLKIGMGMIPWESMQEILDKKDRAAAGPKIEACGLTMIGLEFIDGDNLFSADDTVSSEEAIKSSEDNESLIDDEYSDIKEAEEALSIDKVE